jgi:hypothetical protein
MKKSATVIKILNVLDSVFKCINSVITKYDLIDAIIIAMAIVTSPRFIPATATVIAVRVNKPIHTRIYLPYE